MSAAEPAGQRRVVAAHRLQTGVVGQVAMARRETASGRRGIPSGRCGITRVTSGGAEQPRQSRATRNNQGNVRGRGTAAAEQGDAE